MRSRSRRRPTHCSITPTRGLALAAALPAAGRGLDADAEERRAIELWEAKGATLLVERTRTNRGRVAPVTVTADKPVAAPAALRRRVRPNAATATVGRVTAAFATRDVDAVGANIREDFEQINHPTGSTYGRDGLIASFELLFGSRDPAWAP